MSAVIDLPRIRRALAELDRIAEAHPEMCQGLGQWDEKAVESIIVATPAKDRVRAMRERLAAKGVKREIFFATPEAQAALAELRALRPDQTRDYILCDAVIHLLATHQRPAPAPLTPSPVPDLPADRLLSAALAPALQTPARTATVDTLPLFDTPAGDGERDTAEDRRARILALKRAEPELSNYAIADRIGCSEPTVRRALKRLNDEATV